MPENGIFLSRDPVESEPPYQYVRANPVNRVDPSGLCEQVGDEACWAVYEELIRKYPELANDTFFYGTGQVSLDKLPIRRLRHLLNDPNRDPLTYDDPLTYKQLELSKRAAQQFQIPVELVAGTIAVEIVDDTDWYDDDLDFLFQEVPLGIHYSCIGKVGNALCGTTDRFLEGYEHYWGVLGGRGPGNGIANVHIATAKDTEEYFNICYPEQHLLVPHSNIYLRSATLLSDEGNIYYTAAILRSLADYRTGSKGSHTNDLSDLDMQMIYGRFRCNCWRDWSDFAAATAVPDASRGKEMIPYLQLYRNK